MRTYIFALLVLLPLAMASDDKNCGPNEAYCPAAAGCLQTTYTNIDGIICTQFCDYPCSIGYHRCQPKTEDERGCLRPSMCIPDSMSCSAYAPNY